MMGAPFEGSWTKVVESEAAYYTGAGSGELLWTVIAAAICVIAIVVGGIHEGSQIRKYK